ncbi:hypothetical protein Smp_149550 [Schistosoma mansoni]|uniref:hypothetical protein n=1 Tax=Schistosoma mansoni TaxID=6183 RepID=UPI0001A643BD|nr:hypothetical protein Smp_149550 [Schistosoma mansoni]|eukprot:XP_018646164.1 hypothetical protein Smp_149550 [Schistosoma mansoni]
MCPGYSLATSDWPCGNLYTQCFKTIPIIIVLILLSAGVGGLGLIFLCDLFGACNSKWIPGPVCTTIKLMILFVSASAVLTVVDSLHCDEFSNKKKSDA